ncbi:hypothetical protein ES319_D07G033700v1 [Gossypium barbadense]|uniref:Uncharacterized protein n=1 Tax=Gossypium barbadense TaxID=3634 RepID=A0A5J5QTD8_GOSBA|nr:hypothetical protein ES319_D07G033700v1 [Gossypium barbadense]KAB2019962.1 hypothetical protein ES319_D07G033700v1 [Gossypium barbadense]
MGFAAALRPNLPATFPLRFRQLFMVEQYLVLLSTQRHSWKQKTLPFVAVTRGKGHSLLIVESVLNNSKSSINDNGAAESAKVLLERLFAQTQKLEQGISRDGEPLQDFHLALDLQTLESDLLAALTALKQKEDDLQDAEKMVVLEQSELSRAKDELEQREKEIAAASSKHEKLEEKLTQANLAFASQASQIEDLKLQLKEQDQKVAAAQSTLSAKEDEMDKMRHELVKKTEEAEKIRSELTSKSQLLNEANEVMKKQEIELQELREAIWEREEELETSLTQRKLEEEKLKVAEAKLQQQTMEWLLAQEELKKLAEQASRHMGEANEAFKDFTRVKQLLSDVRSELVSSQKSLASSRQQMEQQEQLLKMQLEELEEQRKSVASYMESLKNAQIEVESERVKLRVVEARNKDLGRDLSVERELIKELQEELKKEKYSLQLAIQDASFLRKQLGKKHTEFVEMNNVLQNKEVDLVEAKLEIQHLKSERASLQLILEEKDQELSDAKKNLEQLNQEIAELKMLMSSKENQLIQATALLKEKDEYALKVQDELNDTKMKFSEAETVIERIAELTNRLVISVKDEDNNVLRPVDDVSSELMHQLVDRPSSDFGLQKKQLETELRFTKESLKDKEMEVLAAQRALAIKDEELKMVLGRLEAREKELQRLKEEMIEDANDIKKLYALAQERIGEKSIGDLAIEKLQLEAAQLEVEAATSALQKLAEMSHELLIKASTSIESDSDTSIFLQSGSDPMISMMKNDESFTEVKTGVAKLSALTEQLVKDAGIVGVHLQS